MSVNTPMISIAGTGGPVTNTITTTGSDTTWNSKFIAHSSLNDGPITFAIDVSSIGGLVAPYSATQLDITDGSLVHIGVGPFISSLGISLDNRNVTLFFNEDVFSTPNGTGDLTLSDIWHRTQGQPDTSDPNRIEANLDAIKKRTNKIYDLSVSYTGNIATGTERIDLRPNTSVFDQFGNSATQVGTNKSINLYERQPPSITNLIISSNNNRDNSIVRAGEIVTLQIYTNETINQPYVVFKSGGDPIKHAVTYIGDVYEYWAAKYTVSESDSAGLITFTVDASDLAGNNATQASGSGVNLLPLEITTTTETTTQGIQLGSVLEGNYENSYYGQTLAISDNGFDVIGVSSTYPFYDSNKHGSTLNNFGYFIWYTWNNITDNWDSRTAGNQFPVTASGETLQTANGIADHENANFGKHVAISGDGNFIAVGQDNFTPDGGRVYMYRKFKSTIRFVGIITDSSAISFGGALDLNYDGSRLIVADPSGSRVHTYDMDITFGNLEVDTGYDTWSYLDYSYSLNATFSDDHGDGYATSVEISGDGNSIIIGYPTANSGRGAVRVFSYDASNNDSAVTDTSSADYGPLGWKIKGQNPIYGVSTTSSIGLNAHSLAINNNGTVIAFGSADNNAIWVYQYDNSSSTWVSKGTPDGDYLFHNSLFSGGDGLGTNVSLDNSGSLVSFGFKDVNDLSGNAKNGAVAVFQYDATKTTKVIYQEGTSQADSLNFGPIGWRLVGSDLHFQSSAAQNSDGEFGALASAISGDGTIVIGGDPHYVSNLAAYTKRGNMMVYETGITRTITTSRSIKAPRTTRHDHLTNNYYDKDYAKAGEVITIYYAFDTAVNTTISIGVYTDVIDSSRISTTFGSDASGARYATQFTVLESDTIAYDDYAVINYTITAEATGEYTGTSVFTDTAGGHFLSIWNKKPSFTQISWLDSSSNQITAGPQSWPTGYHSNTDFQVQISHDIQGSNTNDLFFNQLLWNSSEDPSGMLQLYDANANYIHHKPDTTDFSISLSGGTATDASLVSVTPDLTGVYRDSLLTFRISYTGPANGYEILTVSPKENSIFDGLGGAMSTNQPISNSTLQFSFKDRNELKNTYIDGFVDISGGGITTSNNVPLMIAGDASFIGNVFIRPNVIGDSQQILSQTLSSISFPSNPTKTQFGSDIVGASTGYQSGHAVASNGNGDIVAIGEPTNPSGGTDRGKVKVYEKSGSSWSQLGSDIDGTIDQAQFGHSVDLNGDGTILAVGTKDVSNNALYLYKYDGTTWNQHGNTIHVLSQSDLSFNSHSIAPSINVKLNKEGNKLVTSNKYHVTNTFTSFVPNGNTHSAAYWAIGAEFNYEFRRAGVTGSIDEEERFFWDDKATLNNGIVLDGTDGAVQTYSQDVTLSRMSIRIFECSYETYFKWDTGSDSTAAIFHLDDIVKFNISNTGFSFSYTDTQGNIASYDVTSNSPFSTGNWYHLVVTFDHDYANFVTKVYVNGSLYGSNSVSNSNLSFGNLQNAFKESWLGRSKTNTNKFVGAHRYIRVYTNKELTSSEVTQLYNDRDQPSFNGGPEYADQTFVIEHNEEIVQCYEYSNSSWNQLGNTIESSSIGDLSGGSIDINHEGNTIVVGYPKENNVGSVKVFQYDSSWNQVGGNLVGTETDSMYGHAVTIDGSGDIIGVGIPQHLHSGIETALPGYGSYVQRWPQGCFESTQPFGTISHNNQGPKFSALTNSSPDSTLNSYYSFTLINLYAGAASHTYTYDSNMTGSPSGFLTNSSGTGIAANSSYGDIYGSGTATYTVTDANGNTTNYTGRAMVFDYGANYVLKLSGFFVINNLNNVTSGKIIGRDANDNTKYRYLGNAAGGGSSNAQTPSFQAYGLDSTWEVDQVMWIIESMPASTRVTELYFNGTYVKKDYGKVKIYKNIDNSWNQLGNDINCETDAERLGSSLAMTASGDIIAVGAPYSTQVYFEKGAVRLYQYSETDSSWNKLGDDIVGDLWYDRTGTAIALSDRATSLTIGEPVYDATNTNEINTFKTNIGRTRTFEIEHTPNYSYTYGQTLQSTMIGTTKPLTFEDSVLDVSGSTAITGPLHLSGDASFNKLVANDVSVNSIQGRATANSDVDYSDQTTDLSFSTAIRVLTLDNSFNVSSATIHNDLSSNGDVGADFIYDNTLSIAGSLVIVDASNTNYGSYTVYSQQDSTQSFVVGKSKSNVFNIVNQSNVGVYMSDGNNSFTSTSDIKLKENIKTIDDVNEDLLKLNPVHFEWKSQDNDKKQVGFIAQELEKVYPQFVSENEDDEKHKTINSSKLISYLIKGIQEINKEIEELENNI